MANGSAAVLQKLWNYCNVLRDAGLSYGDYIEQLTYLLFLKMAHERKQFQPERAPHFPEGYQWSALLGLEGDALEVHYRKPCKPCAAARFAPPRCARCGTATPGGASCSPLGAFTVGQRHGAGEPWDSGHAAKHAQAQDAPEQSNRAKESDPEVIHILPNGSLC